MDYDDSDSEGRRGLTDADPLPPDDWHGHGRTARAEAAYAAHGPALARFFRRRAASQDVGDLVQELFRRFVSGRFSAPLPADETRPYLFDSARNLLAERARRDERRRTAAHIEYDDRETADHCPHERLEMRDELARVERAISKLKPRTRDIFLMHRFEGLSSVAVDAAQREHWLISDGRWSIRLDLNDGTLLGGPILVEHRITGIVSAKAKLEALRQFVVLAQLGNLPASMMPRERRAAQWILELRAADALLDAAPQQDIARALFDRAIATRRWRIESASYRLRTQRLVKIARLRLAEPLSGPWFD